MCNRRRIIGRCGQLFQVSGLRRRPLPGSYERSRCPDSDQLRHAVRHRQRGPAPVQPCFRQDPHRSRHADQPVPAGLYCSVWCRYSRRPHPCAVTVYQNYIPFSRCSHRLPCGFSVFYCKYGRLHLRRHRPHHHRHMENRTLQVRQNHH